MATRQCSSSVINRHKRFTRTYWGVCRSKRFNNTKTDKAKVITSKNFNANYIHYGVREHAMAGS